MLAAGANKDVENQVGGWWEGGRCQFERGSMAELGS